MLSEIIELRIGKVQMYLIKNHRAYRVFSAFEKAYDEDCVYYFRYTEDEEFLEIIDIGNYKIIFANRTMYLYDQHGLIMSMPGWKLRQSVIWPGENYIPIDGHSISLMIDALEQAYDWEVEE